MLDYTRYPVCLVYVRKGPRISSTTFETEKIEGKRPELSIGRTRKREGQLAGLVIGRTMISEGHLPGCPLIPVIGSWGVRWGSANTATHIVASIC